MTPITQADRQWLDHLYSKSPSTAFDYWIFRTYYRVKQTCMAWGDAYQRTHQWHTAQITSSCDLYGNVLWHACDPVHNLSFTTYSRQELQRWLESHYPNPDNESSDANHQWLSGSDG